MLLLKCRDAIENLHQEIEEERAEKVRMGEQLQEYQKYMQEVQMNDQDRNFKIQKLTEDSIQFQSEIHLLGREKDRLVEEKEALDQKLINFE